MKRRVLLLISFFVPFLGYSQEKAYSAFDKILQINKPALEHSLSLPIFTLGTGIVSYHGDVQNDESPNFSIGNNGFHFEILQPVSPSVKFGVRYERSQIRGTSYYPEIMTQYNFKTEINSFGAFVHYNFDNFRRITNRSKIIKPYVSIGVSILQRPEARGDYYAANGERIDLWSDGTFRNLAQTDYNASRASVLYRDNNYETAMQEEDIEQREYYTPIVATFPIELGLTYNISKSFKINLGYRYNFTATNTLDDITNKGVEGRKSSKFPDGYSYAYVSVTTYLSQLAILSKFKSNPNELYYTEWDADLDGIDETEDDCPYTPKGVRVFADGCPFDDDKDGIPNYRDVEVYTKGFSHDAKGKSITEAQLLDLLTKGERLSQEELYKFYPDLLNGSTINKQFYKRIPKKFKKCDADENDFIDLDELLNTINSFFDEGPDAGPGANLSSKDLSELIEFFFLQ